MTNDATIIMTLCLDTEEVVGFSIINFRKWFRDAKDIKILPVKADLAHS